MGEFYDHTEECQAYRLDQLSARPRDPRKPRGRHFLQGPSFEHLSGPDPDNSFLCICDPGKHRWINDKGS